MVSKPKSARSLKGKTKRAPNPDDYEGILSKTETRKRIKRKKKEDAKAPEPAPIPVEKPRGGRPKGSFSLRSQLRKTLQTLRGNRPLFEHVIDALVDAAISGDKDFKTSALKLILEHLEGKPMQTIVADVTNRDGYAHLSDEELLRIAGLAPLAPGAPAAPVAPEERNGES